ncbi:protein NRT1/ PTR FAMILY 5.10-like [Helianthus annuus]|uniref:protein NRT1/ PTR FAMILY 5.10-like n=1 Tax=Helianthus annuus TaxID=4232 RepID=UPI001652C66D|nr:protein NRT1/ PTR FAMILY 5.10-like [Helianthus annuus]
MAYLADSFIGRFQTLLFSNIAYIGALVLFYMFHPYDVTWLLVISLVLLALGTSGDQILEDVLQDLVNDIDKSPDREETRSIARATIWSRVTNMSAAVLSTLLWAIPHATSGLDSSWKSAFVICIIPMILAVIVSGFGHNVYHQGELTEIQLDILGCLKIFSRHKRSPKNMDIEKGETEGIKQEITLHLEDKVVLKSLLEMLPMWVVFSVVSIISAAGNTFFLQQYSNLDTDNDIAVQLYTLVQEFSSFAIAFLYRWICCLPKNEKVKIGVGMLCGLVSCICAWQLEVYRLKEVSYLVDEEHTYTSISFLWLVPQFCLVGCMKGLTEEGLLEFYNSQMKKEHYLQRYREEYIAFVMGIGKVLNIFLILICRGWFGDTINESRLDKYYSVMVCVGSANFITYCCIARFFYKGQELVDADDDVDFANDDVQQDHFIEQSSDIEQQKDLANDDQNHDNQDFANDDLQRYYSREQSRDIEQNRDTGLASSFESSKVVLELS